MAEMMGFKIGYINVISSVRRKTQVIHKRDGLTFEFLLRSNVQREERRYRYVLSRW